jgi:hypothetical protein
MVMAVVAVIAPPGRAWAGVTDDSAPVPYGMAPSDTAKYYESSYAVTATPANYVGASTVSWPTTWDRDSAELTYTIYRDGMSAPVYQTTAESNPWSRTPLSFVDSGLVPGSQHAYKLVVTDPLGNSTTTHSLINDTDGSVKYSHRQWSYASDRSFGEYRGDAHYTQVPGATATFTFFGSAVEYITTKDQDRGIVKISVDGGEPDTVNTYNATRTANLAAWSKSGLSQGQHRVTITNQSGAALIDGFRVVTRNGSDSRSDHKVIDDTSTTIRYTGSGWGRYPSRYTGNNAADFGGGVHSTTVNGDSVSLTFSGTAASMLLETGSAAGPQTFNVFMDGAYWGTLTTPAVTSPKPTFVGQQLAWYTAGLPNRSHTLTITKAGGNYLLVDAFVIGTSSGAPGSLTHLKPSYTNQKVAIPAYWTAGTPNGDAKFTKLTQSAPVNDIVIITGRAPNAQAPFAPAWAQTLKKAHDSGQRAIGYVDTGFLGTGIYPATHPNPTRIDGPGRGSTSVSAWITQIKQDVDDWYSLYGAYGVDGIFLDQTTIPCGTAGDSMHYANIYAEISDYITRNHAGAYIVINPGAPVGQCYENVADTIVTFEGNYEKYMNNQAAPWQLNSAHPEKFWNIIWGVPATTMPAVISRSKQQNAGYIYVTNEDGWANPYGTIASYWDSELIAAFGVQPSPLTADTST